MPWLSSTCCVFSLEVVCSITLLPASSRQCWLRNGGVAISPKYFIFAVPSFSYFFPVPVQVASTSDSPLGKISCSVDPSWDRVPSGNMLAVCSLPWSCISSSSLSQHLLCGFSLFLPILLSTECLLLLFFSPSEKCRIHGGRAQLCVAVSLFWSRQDPPVSAIRQPHSPPTNATPVSSTLMPTLLKTAIDCIQTSATTIPQW